MQNYQESILVKESIERKRHRNELVELLAQLQFSEEIWEQAFPNKQIPPWLIEDNFEISSYWLYEFIQKCNEREVLELWIKNKFLVADSLWLEELWFKWQQRISSVFFLTGNINDYTYSHRRGFKPAIDILVDEFLARQDSSEEIIEYSLARSFEYPEQNLVIDSDIANQIAAHKDENQEERSQWNRLVQDFKFIDTLFREESNLLILVKGADLIFATETNNITQNLLADFLIQWAFSTQLARRNNAIVLVAESSDNISRFLVGQSNKVEVIDIPRPKLDLERLRFIIYLFATTLTNTIGTRRVIKKEIFQQVKENDDWLNASNPSADLLILAQYTSGLNYIGIEDLLLQISSGQTVESEINRIKGNILQTESSGLLELVKSEKDLAEDIRGYKEIKQRLLSISSIINDPTATKLRKRTIPMGILFVGPPGTGKTVVAEAFSNACGMNFLKLGDFRSKWVGESERNLSKVLELIKSYSPVIVFMDELDQTEGGRGTSGGNSVDKRLFSKLLQFMSDTTNRGKVLWIAASNRPDFIDPALKRPGRFDLKIPFLPQEAQDRRDTFDAYLSNEKYPELKTNIPYEEWIQIVNKTDKYTGAEVEEIVNSTIRKKILQSTSQQKDIEITATDLLATIRNFQPGINTEVFNNMIEASLADVTSKELISQSWQNWQNPFKRNTNESQYS